MKTSAEEEKILSEKKKIDAEKSWKQHRKVKENVLGSWH